MGRKCHIKILNGDEFIRTFENKASETLMSYSPPKKMYIALRVPYGK